MKLLFVDFSTCLDTVNDLDTRARGGMINSLFRVPEYLAKNHEVAVWSDIKKGSLKNSVRWYTVGDYENVVGRGWDFAIFNRGAQNGLPELITKHRVLWTHDLPHGGFAKDPKILKAFAAVVFMSRYAEKVWRLYYQTIGRSFLIPNGVDEGFYPRKKDLGYLIYISAPNRGLHRIGLLFAGIKAKTDLRLRFKAYSNMRVLHPMDKESDAIPNEGERDIYNMQFPGLEENGVEVLDPIPKISEELGRAGLMILPTGYPEICSNAILQSLASGTPVVTTGDLGSAPEWIKHGWNGGMTKTKLEDYMVHLVELTRMAASILNNKALHFKMIHNASKTKGLYTWDQIGARWEKMLKKLY